MDEQDDAFRNGMHYYFPKPVDLELLSFMLQAKKLYADLESCLFCVTLSARLLAGHRWVGG